MTPGQRKRRNKKILAGIEKQLEAQWNADTDPLMDVLWDRVRRNVDHKRDWQIIWNAHCEAAHLIVEATRPHVSLNYVAAILDRATNKS